MRLESPTGLARAARTALIAVVAFLVLGAGTAYAGATVSVSGFPAVVNYVADAGTENRPTFECQFYYDGTADTCVVKDFQGVTAGTGCVQDSSQQVTCVGHFGTSYPLNVQLGDFDDVCIVRFSNSVGGAQIDAGSGHDYVESGDGTGGDLVMLGLGDDWLNAGYGSDAGYGSGGQDTMIGGPGTNVLRGGNGNDTLLSGAWIGTGSVLYGENGHDYLQGGWAADRLSGGAGNDYLDGGRANDDLDGGLDFDTVTYDSRVEDVSVTFNGLPDDGGATFDDSPFNADRDNVRVNVERILGGTARDFLTAGVAPVVFHGGLGNDRLTGGGGADTLLGEGGNDALRGMGGADTLDGGPGDMDEILYDERTARVTIRLDGLRNDGADPNANRISSATEEGDLDLGIERARGSSAGDYLRGNAGVNRLLGLFGNDDVQSRDGTTAVDIVNCGPGTDRYDKDPSDSAIQCETPTLLP
jgi:Ca2+-binding RTX toxin-like protein